MWSPTPKVAGAIFSNPRTDASIQPLLAAPGNRGEMPGIGCASYYQVPPAGVMTEEAER